MCECSYHKIEQLHEDIKELEELVRIYAKSSMETWDEKNELEYKYQRLLEVFLQAVEEIDDLDILVEHQEAIIKEITADNEEQEESLKTQYREIDSLLNTIDDLRTELMRKEYE